MRKSNPMYGYKSIFLSYLQCLGTSSITAISLPDTIEEIINDINTWIKSHFKQKDKIDYTAYFEKIKTLWQALNQTKALNQKQGALLIDLILNSMGAVENAIFKQDTKDDPLMRGHLLNRDTLSSVVGRFLLQIIPKLAQDQQEYLFSCIIELLRSESKSYIPKNILHQAQLQLAEQLGNERIMVCCDHYLSQLDEIYPDPYHYDFLPILLSDFCTEDYRYKFFNTMVEKLIANGADRVKQKMLQYLFAKVYKQLTSEQEKNHIYHRVILPMQTSPQSFLRQSLTEILRELPSSVGILNELFTKDPDSEVRRFAYNVLKYDLSIEPQKIDKGFSDFSDGESSNEDSEDKPRISFKKVPFISESQLLKKKTVVKADSHRRQELVDFEKSISAHNLKSKCIVGLNHANPDIRQYSWDQLKIRYITDTSDKQKKTWVNIIFTSFLKPNFVLSEDDLMDYVVWTLVPIQTLSQTVIGSILSLLRKNHEAVYCKEWSNLLLGFLVEKADSASVLNMIDTYRALITDENCSIINKRVFVFGLSYLHDTRPGYENQILSFFVEMINFKNHPLREYICEFVSYKFHEVSDSQLSDIEFFRIISTIDLNIKIKDDSKFQEMMENMFGFLVSLIAKHGNSAIGNYAIKTLIKLITQVNQSFYALLTQQFLIDYGIYYLDSLSELIKIINRKITTATEKNITHEEYSKLTCYIDNNEIFEAEKHIRKLEKKWISLPQLEFYKAEIKFRSHQYDRAIEDYNNFLLSQPHYIRAKIRLFECYQNLGAFYQAHVLNTELYSISPQLQLPSSSCSLFNRNLLLPLENCVQQAVDKLSSFSQISVQLIKDDPSSDVLQEAIEKNFEDLKKYWIMYFGKELINHYFDNIPEIKWGKLINYPHQFSRYFLDLFLGILSKVVPIQSVQYYDIYYQYIQRMRSLDEHILESEILGYVQGSNPIEFLRNQFEVYSAYDFVNTYIFTEKLKDACALGLSEDISSAYNLLTGVLQLKHWELVYHEVDVEPSGTTAHTNKFMDKALKRSQAIVMFVPIIVKKTDKDNPTLDEIRYLLAAASRQAFKGKVYLVFGAYEFFPIYIQHFDPIIKELSLGASFKVNLDHLIRFYNIPISKESKAKFYRELINHMLVARICININAVTPDDGELKAAIEDDLKKLLSNQIGFLALVKAWLIKFPHVDQSGNNNIYIAKKWKSFPEILRIIDALLFTRLPWINSRYQLPDLSFIDMLEETLKNISYVFDNYFRQQVFKTNDIDSYIEEINKFLDNLLILKSEIEYGLRWKGITDYPDKLIEAEMFEIPKASPTIAPSSTTIKPPKKLTHPQKSLKEPSKRENDRPEKLENYTPKLFLPPKTATPDVFSKNLSINKNYFDAMSQALTELDSSALPESEAGDAEIIAYLKSIFKNDEKIIISDERWSLDVGNQEKGLYFMGINFPWKQFLVFLIEKPQESCFILPINIKASHYCGLAIRIKEKKINTELTSIQIQCHYINPTSSKENETAEDKQVFQSLKETFNVFRSHIFPQLSNPDFKGIISDPIGSEHTIQFFQENMNENKPITIIKDEPINHSCYQQNSTCDCGFIVAQSLVDIAMKNNLTIPSFTVSPEICIRKIAETRANFCQDDKILRSQYFLRLAKALCENSIYWKPLREYIYNIDFKKSNFEPSKQNFLNCLKTVAINCGMGKEGFENTEGDSLTDLARNFIQNISLMKNITTKELNEYCEWLLEPTFEAQGSVIFKLNHHREEPTFNPVLKSSEKLSFQQPSNCTLFYSPGNFNKNESDLKPFDFDPNTEDEVELVNFDD